MTNMTADDVQPRKPADDDEIQLICDGDGLAVLGSPTAVERFLSAQGLLALSRDLVLDGLGPVLRASAAVAQAGAEISASSGRWLKLTEESARLVEESGLMETESLGVSYAMVGERGSISSWLQVETGALTNPALLAGVAGLMAQLTAQHEMDEIKNYLATIDKKVDDVLRAQKNAELAKLIGAGLDIRSALAVRERASRVDEVTWSTVQGRTHTITDALSWALLQLDSLAKRMENTTRVGDLAKVAAEAEREVQELLAVLARCFELQDAIDLLRLDRVMEVSPEALEGNRLALKAERRDRQERAARTTERLIDRMDRAAGKVELKVLLHPTASHALVGSINGVGATVQEFHGPLGIESSRHPLETTRWREAVRDLRQLKNAAVELVPAALTAGASMGIMVAVSAKKATGRDEDQEQ